MSILKSILPISGLFFLAIASSFSACGTATDQSEGDGITISADEQDELVGTKHTITDTTVLVEGVTISGAKTVQIGESIQLSVSVTPATASSLQTSFSIDAPDRAQISESGQLRGLALGDVLVTATATDGSGSNGSHKVMVVASADDWDGDGITNSVDADADGDGWLDVDNINELFELRNNPNASTADLQGVEGALQGYELTRDLDFQNESHYADATSKTEFTTTPGWSPIHDFASSLTGNGFTVSNLFIKTGSDYAGFFGQISSSSFAHVRDIHFASATIDGPDFTGILAGKLENGSVSDVTVQGSVLGGDRTGGLVGEAQVPVTNASATVTLESSGTNVGGLIGYLICNCSFSGNTSAGQVTASSFVGGLVGQLQTAVVSHASSSAAVHATIGGGNSAYAGGLIGRMGTAVLSESFAAGDVTAANSDHVGGLIGYGSDSGVVRRSYATGDVFGRNFVAGLIGLAEMSNGVTDVYATGSYSGQFNVAGLVGRLGNAIGANVELANAYAVGVSGSISETAMNGGLIGDIPNGTVHSAYWDYETTGYDTSAGGVSQTTTALQSPIDNSGIYSNWDPAIWDFGSNSQYPALISTPGGIAAQRP